MAEVDQSLHLGVGVVDALDHSELIARSTTGLLDIGLESLVEAEERVLLHAGHELVARALDRGVKGHREGELLGELGEALDAGDDATGGDGQVPCADGEAVGVVEDAQGFDGLVEVGEGSPWPMKTTLVTRSPKSRAT